VELVVVEMEQDVELVEEQELLVQVVAEVEDLVLQQMQVMQVDQVS
tara:strand:- start:56 stop:193 length:138 start_codon:yes stop_codon:yes gene_type:complete